MAVRHGGMSDDRPPPPAAPRLPKRLLREGWWLEEKRGPAEIIPFPRRPGTVVVFPAHLLPTAKART